MDKILTSFILISIENIVDYYFYELIKAKGTVTKLIKVKYSQ